MTVGYGDIVPVKKKIKINFQLQQTIPEKIFVTFITFFVSGVFGYAVS